MAEFKNKEEYEKWKMEKTKNVKEVKEQPTVKKGNKGFTIYFSAIINILGIISVTLEMYLIAKYTKISILPQGVPLFSIFTALGIVTAIIASRKSANYFWWYFFGFTVFPLALPMAIFIKAEKIKKRGFVNRCVKDI
jgi:hypothetical protein